MVTVVISDTLRLGGQPRKKAKKRGGKGSVASSKENIQLVCVSRDSPQKKSILREVGRWRLNHAVKLSKTTMRHAKIGESKGPSQGSGLCTKSVPQERIPWAPKFEERTQDETLEQDRCARRHAWEVAKDVYKLKEESKDTFYSLFEAWVMRAPCSKKPESENLWSILFWSVGAHAEQKGSMLKCTGNSPKIHEPHQGGNSQWRSAEERGSTSISARSSSLP